MEERKSGALQDMQRTTTYKNLFAIMKNGILRLIYCDFPCITGGGIGKSHHIDARLHGD